MMLLSWRIFEWLLWGMNVGLEMDGGFVGLVGRWNFAEFWRKE